MVINRAVICYLFDAKSLRIKYDLVVQYSFICLGDMSEPAVARDVKKAVQLTMDFLAKHL
jgi:hypothetical protein